MTYFIIIQSLVIVFLVLYSVAAHSVIRKLREANSRLVNMVAHRSQPRSIPEREYPYWNEGR